MYGSRFEVKIIKDSAIEPMADGGLEQITFLLHDFHLKLQIKLGFMYGVRTMIESFELVFIASHSCIKTARIIIITV